MGPRLIYVRVYDFFCEGPWFFRQTSDVIRPDGDIPANGNGRELRAAMMRSACGDGASPALLLAWEYLTGVSPHSSRPRAIFSAGPETRHPRTAFAARRPVHRPSRLRRLPGGL